jgi:hypothetical protein
MKKIIIPLALTSIFLVSANVSAKATKQEAKSFCEKAAAHEEKVGTDQALIDWSFPESKKNGWFTSDLYVFAVDQNINVLAHGANENLIGKNLKRIKSQDQADGTKGFYFMQEMLKMSKSGKKGIATQPYNFITPNSKKNQARVSYVYPFSNGMPGYFGCGYYL